MRTVDVYECLELLVSYCDLIQERIKRYNMTAQNIAENADYLDLLLMPIFQIGELVGSGSYYGALQELHPCEIWHQANGMRNRIAHAYSKVNPKIVWETAIQSIPQLHTLCTTLLQQRP